MQNLNTPDLRAVSIQARSHSVRSRVLLAFTYCRLARTELSYKQLADAMKLLKAIEDTIDSVRQNMANASDLPPAFVREMVTQLDRLEHEFAQIKGEAKAALEGSPKVA